ncbi:UvrD-helicase domain-containing protein [Sinosporangium siamense]|uniref:DNA 3'-5' helicase n=1 Tax=Sinosporangium siamense TaxID=1367973 RepID=A0A919RFT7_9ACTN|nr:UvrD-helicase domain-containing protein [Sinosporangium siamense]GII93111.1 DNA helicase [Sinosporangium siamense]
MPRLAIAPEFPRDLATLADSVRRDVVVAVRRFLASMAAAPHAERVRGARDDRMATLRLADRHRGVVVRQRDVYWLLAVLPDAEAWLFAQRFRVGVNLEIGVVELWDAEALERIEPALHRAAETTESRLLSHVCDADLLSVGIDPQFLPLVRLVATEIALEAIEPLIPRTQFLPLAVLARGGTLADAWRELASCRTAAVVPGPIAPDDLHAALRRSPDRAMFTPDRHELDRVLTRPLWCTFLYPQQHRLARTDRYDRPVLVTGGAGTGKTLVALHRAAHLARQGAGAVLLVSFSQRLSSDLSARLDLLIDDDVVRKRVEVGNVDRLAQRIVAEAEGRQPTLAGNAELAELWQEAGELSGTSHGAAFLMREWEQVVLAQNLQTLDEYRNAERFGRSVELSGAEREAVWKAITYVMTRLRESGRRTLLQLAAEASALLGRSTGDLLDETGPRREPYRHIVVDEAQDLHPAQWRLLRAAVPRASNDLFIVGDPHQRIFDTRVTLSAVGISAVPRRLHASHRLPQEILSFGVRLRGGGPVDGLVEGVQEMYGYRATRPGARPVVRAYDSLESELNGLVTHITTWLGEDVEPDQIAVAARTTDLVRDARTALRTAGLAVRVTTLHGMKGLEFRRVAVIGVADGVVPAPGALTPAGEDPTARAHDLQRERGLLYVACTRAYELLYVSYSGRASPFLPP